MPRFRIFLPLPAVAALASCEYVRLLPSSVLKQLNPRVVRLVNELPRVDDPNERGWRASSPTAGWTAQRWGATG